MAIASITVWLNNPARQYNQGLLIYEQYGTNQVTLTLLKSGSGSYHFSKLQKALEDLNEKEDLLPKPIIIGDYIPEEIVSPGKNKLDYKTAPEQVVAIRDNKNKSFAQARKLYEVIRVMDDQDHRLQAGMELLDHMDHVQESWQAIDAWNNTGEVKEIAVQAEVANVASLTHAQLLQEANNLPSYISKAKKTLQNSKKQNIILKASSKLSFNENRLMQIRERLENEFI